MHVVITGASSGIGQALARSYARAGANLTLVARRRDPLEALAAEAGRAGVRTHVVQRDLADVAVATDWVADAERALGPIDVLINNAGVQVIGHTASIDVEAGERSFALNVFAPLRLARAVLPGMLERRAGTVVNVASIAAFGPVPGMTYYNGTKGALAAASESLRGELRGTGVNVVTVYPGIIPATEMGHSGLQAYAPSKLTDLQPTGKPDVLADKVRRAVKRRSARVVYPRFNILARWLPGPTRWLLDRLTPGLAENADDASLERAVHHAA